ncbi:hypothetical protein Sango_0153400 [Sesamum angolense]|uniref:DNA-directed RNA polymerase n=1 Tax=Sesamum angolense TaxID=2727404 RepID=A0AAE1XG71_9LAMI|nr:hypothetical protein Sango_0153400 [Sesamum angolense]
MFVLMISCFFMLVFDLHERKYSVYVCIFRLEPKFAALEAVAEKEVKEGVVTTEEKTDKFRNLTLMYSTKKNIRRDVKRETLRQTEDPEMQQNLEHKIKGIKINTQALEAIASTSNARNTPPYDLEATAAHKAYPLDKIILKGNGITFLIFLSLQMLDHNFTPDLYPTFVCNRVHQLETIKDESKKRKMAGILSYMTHLIRFKDRHTMDGVSSTSKRHKLPTILSHRFSSMFDITNNNRVPDEKQKLLISYVLVLSLFVDGFRSNPSDIAKDLRINPLMLRSHYEYLGCKFVREIMCY